MMNEIEVTSGICTGRNGTFEISAVSISEFEDTIRIDGISKKRRKILNAGLSMDRSAAKKLAEAISGGKVKTRALNAAVPELIEAVKSFINLIDSLPDDTEKCRILKMSLNNRPGELIREAIAKISGGSNNGR